MSPYADAAQILNIHYEFFPYQLCYLLFSWTFAERSAHISRCQASQTKRDERNLGTPLHLGESRSCSLRRMPSNFIRIWYNCIRVRASLGRHDVLGCHGCTMQPPVLNRRECKKIQLNSLGLTNFKYNLASPNPTCFDVPPLDHMVNIYDYHLNGPKYHLSFEVGNVTLGFAFY
jgi:hypothetical protein